MKLTVDENTCLKHKLTFEEFLVAYTVGAVKDYEGTLHNLLNRQVIVKREGRYYVTQPWGDTMDEIICDSTKGSNRSDEEILALAQKLREVYPEGKMRNQYGGITPYYYRCNNSEVTKALKRFFVQRGNYSDEEIIDATRRYVASFQGQYWQKGMRLLKYFILKDARKQGEDGTNHVEQVSDLETYLCNKDEEVKTSRDDDSWLMSARN